MEGRPSTPDVDTLEAEIIGSLPRSVDDPAWESPTATKVRDLAARARELEADENFVRAEALQAELGSMEDRAEAAEADRDRLLGDLQSVRAECGRFDAEAERLARRVAELEQERERARNTAQANADLLVQAEDRVAELEAAVEIAAALPSSPAAVRVAELEAALRAVRRIVTKDGFVSAFLSADHLCNGKCPDEDDMGRRDPYCLPCVVMDFPALAGDGGGDRRSTNQSFMGSVNTTGWNRDSGNPPTAGDRDGA